MSQENISAGNGADGGAPRGRFDINMPALKRFLRRVGIGAIPVFLGMCLIGYYAIEVRCNLTGDLGKLGKIQFGPEYQVRTYPLGYPDTLVVWYPHCGHTHRVGVIGDSFAYQYPSGFAAALGHELADTVDVYTLSSQSYSPVQAAVDLVKSDFFEKHPQVKTVIVESVERMLVHRWADVDFNKENKMPVLKSRVPVMLGTSEQHLQSQLSALQKETIDWVKLSLKIFDSPVRSIPLKQKVFSHDEMGSQLYFYYHDLSSKATPDRLQAVRTNVERLHGLFAAKGVEMIMMISPDKYEVYQHFAADNPYEPIVLSAQLSETLAGLDYVVNPTEAVTRLVASGEQDVYYLNDSHWSPKGARVAGAMLAEKVRGQSSEVEK